jgi:hypothetical protein
MTTMTAGARPRGRLRRFARWAWRTELGVWQGLYRFLFRRPRVPAGATAFAYHAPVRMVLIVFIVVSAIEIPIVDLIVHDWTWIRIPLLIGGIWGVTWMLGLLLGFITRPHAVGPAGIIARMGSEVVADLPWEAVLSVERTHERTEKAPPVSDEVHGRTLGLRMQDESNVLVVLERPVIARRHGLPVEIDAVRLWADDATGFLAAVRTHMP